MCLLSSQTPAQLKASLSNTACHGLNHKHLLRHPAAVHALPTAILACDGCHRYNMAIEHIKQGEDMWVLLSSSNIRDAKARKVRRRQPQARQ